MSRGDSQVCLYNVGFVLFFFIDLHGGAEQKRKMYSSGASLGASTKRREELLSGHGGSVQTL